MSLARGSTVSSWRQECPNSVLCRRFRTKGHVPRSLGVPLGEANSRGRSGAEEGRGGDDTLGKAAGRHE